MAGPIMLMQRSQDAGLVKPSKNTVTVTYNGSTAEFESSEFDTQEFRKEPPVKPMKKMSSMKKFSTTMKKMRFDDTASIASASMRSTTEKSVRMMVPDLKKAKFSRMPTCFDDPTTKAKNKISSALSKYDDDLGNILLNQSPDDPEPIVAVNRDNLQKIKLLGSGQFCNVHSVSGELDLLNQGETKGRRRIYALKAVNPKKITDNDGLIIAASDLAAEATVLSQLDHKNVIKVRGLSCETFSKSFMGIVAKNCSGSQRSLRGLSARSFKDSLKKLGSLKNLSFKRLTSFRGRTKSASGIQGYFLLLDVLTGTLSDRFAKQRREIRRTPESKRSPNTKEAVHSRIKHVAMGIVEGMQYLHSQDVVLRDLKPANVGFDDEGNVKLFDFGMARKISDCPHDEICGSPRYMAPEVMEGKGYTLKVDVYSFGILLYELCTLEIPFNNSCALMRQRKKCSNWKKKRKRSFDIKSLFKPRTSKQASQVNEENEDDDGGETDQANLLIEFYRKVVYEEMRPSKNILESSAIPCSQLRALIHECWSPDPEKRPTFEEISKRMERIFH